MAGTKQPQPPHNQDAEEALLGCLLIDPAAWWEISGIVTAADFYVVANMWVFEEVAALYEAHQPVDAVTLCDALDRRGQLEEIGGAAHLLYLMGTVPSALEAVAYAELVVEEAKRRRMLDVATKLAKGAHDKEADPEVVAAAMARALLQDERAGRGVSVGDAGGVLCEKLETWNRDPLGPGEVRGLASGLVALDGLLEGFEPGLYVVGGRASMGKSALVLQIAANAAESGASVLFFSLEMTAAQVVARLACARARVAWGEAKAGRLGAADWLRLYDALAQIGEWRLAIDSSDRVRQVVAAVHRAATSLEGLDLVVIDYLGLLIPEGKAESRNLALGGITHHLVRLARDAEIPLILVHQVGRAPDQRQDKRPVLSDLYESGHIEQDADVVLMVYREAYYDKVPDDETHVMEVIVRKNRLGGSVARRGVYFGDFAEVRNLARSVFVQPPSGDGRGRW